MDYTTIGILEFSSIAAGIEALDAMVKAAPVVIIDAATVCPGKYYITITGQVAEVDAALTAGKRNREEQLIDQLFIPNLHKYIIPAIRGTAVTEKWEALGIFESFSVTGSIIAGDLAAKETEVEIPEIILGVQIGGKSILKMIGSVNEVNTAMETALSYAKSTGLLCNHTIIPQAHPEIIPFVIRR